MKEWISSLSDYIFLLYIYCPINILCFICLPLISEEGDNFFVNVQFLTQNKEIKHHGFTEKEMLAICFE